MMDKEYFVQEIEAHSELMYRVAFTILHNDDACRDALQETALKAWEKRGTLREERYFRTWITRILINTCYDLGKKRSRTIPLASVPQPTLPPPDPTLALALSALSEKLRLPLVLCYVEGMSYAEIAQSLRIPLPTVRGRIHRAKAALRQELTVE